MATPSPSNQGYGGMAGPEAGASDLNALDLIVRAITGRFASSTVVRVDACTNAGGVAAVGFVDVTPLVNQIDGDGNAVPHTTIFGLPYLRMQGGTNAIIIDPQPGDIGIAVFASHDISSVKANKAQSNPGSRRRFDMADGMYIGGILNGTPTRIVRFTSSGIIVKAPDKVTIEAPEIEAKGNVTITGNAKVTGNAEITGTTKLTGNVTAEAKITAAEGDIGGTGTQAVKLADGSNATKLKAK